MQDQKTQDFLEKLFVPAEELAKREALREKIMDSVPLRKDLQEKPL